RTRRRERARAGLGRLQAELAVRLVDGNVVSRRVGVLPAHGVAALDRHSRGRETALRDLDRRRARERDGAADENCDCESREETLAHLMNLLINVASQVQRSRPGEGSFNDVFVLFLYRIRMIGKAYFVRSIAVVASVLALAACGG